MSQCLFCENSLEMYCKECQESYCHHCGILKHLQDGAIQPHCINYLCEECEEDVSSAYCKSCEQNLCPGCDIKIHNKGKRAQHTREPLAKCVCMKDIKIIVHLTLNFLKTYCEIEDSGDFIEQLEEMSSNILLSHKDLDLHNVIFISILEDGSLELSPDEHEKLAQTLKKIRIKNFLLFQSVEIAQDFTSFKQIFIKDKSFDDGSEKKQSAMQRAYKIHQVLKDIKDIEHVCLFDTFRNETLARALKVTPSLENKKIYLNFDLSNPRPLESTLFVSKVLTIEDRSDSRGSQSAIVPQLMFGSSISQGKKVSEPFIPQHISDPQMLNSADRKDSATNNHVQFWGQNSPPKDAYKKSNQSFDEMILNASSDQILQKRSAPFLKHQLPYNNPQSVAQRRLNILTDQPLKNIELNGSLRLSHSFQQELRKFADRGDLLIMKEDFISKLQKSLPDKFKCNIEDIMKQAEEAKIIHTTIRKFLETKPLSYIGVLLDSLTLESLIWIVRSIKNDSMTPTEKLILSRVKECYGLKIEQNFWKNMLSYISANQSTRQSKANSFEHTNIFPLYTKKVLDPVTNTDTYVLYLTTEEWTPEDQGTIDENSEEWKGFLQFILNFFKEDENSVDHHNRSGSFIKNPAQELEQDLSKKATWSSSVENVLNRSTSKKDKSLKISEDIKAIPGGRYGCAQFIKICGPDVLTKLSIGRLTLFVQEAINKGIIRYQRTLLVKNNPNDSIISTLTELDGTNTSFSQDPGAERKAKLLKTIKDVLIDILSETPEGIPLAQIPLHLKRKMDYVVNFQELGFPKLKNFLATIPELVKIESSGTNHAFVKLKNPMSSSSRKNLAYKEQNFLPDTQDSTRNSNGTQMNQTPILHNSMTNTNILTQDQSHFDPMRSKFLCNQKFNILTPSPDVKNPKGPRKKMSTLDDYLNKVKGIIELILTDNCYGISLQKLYKDLSAKLGFDFDYGLFNCSDFNEFLMNQAENLVDIEIKKNCLIIYPKNFRFGTQTLVNVINTDQQRTSIKPAEFGIDPAGDNRRGFNNNQLNPNASPFQFNDRMYRGNSDLDMPPGLMKYNNNKQNIVAYNNVPFNNFGYGPNMSHNNMNNQNLSNTSPIFYGQEDEGGDKDLVKHIRNVSYWKLEGNSNMNGEEGRQAISHSVGMNQPDPRNIKVQVQEESTLDIRENLRFIEELLQDNDINEKSMMTNFTLDRTHESSFGGIQSPNLSFTGLTAIHHGNQTLKQNHSKTHSDDFSNKNVLKFSTGQHGRVSSAVTERKND